MERKHWGSLSWGGGAGQGPLSVGKRKAGLCASLRTHAHTHRLRLKLANNGHQLAEKLNMNVPNHIFYVEANKQRKSPSDTVHPYVVGFKHELNIMWCMSLVNILLYLLFSLASYLQLIFICITNTVSLPECPIATLGQGPWRPVVTSLLQLHKRTQRAFNWLQCIPISGGIWRSWKHRIGPCRRHLKRQCERPFPLDNGGFYTPK